MKKLLIIALTIIFVPVVLIQQALCNHNYVLKEKEYNLVNYWRRTLKINYRCTKCGKLKTVNAVEIKDRDGNWSLLR